MINKKIAILVVVLALIMLGLGINGRLSNSGQTTAQSYTNKTQIGINVKQLVKYVIRPSLRSVGLYSIEAEQLLLGTAAQETGMGHYIHQIVGPALGIYQMEPNTYVGLWNGYVKSRPELERKIRLAVGLENSTGLPPKELLITDLKFATIMSRVYYLRVDEALPGDGDIVAQAMYWKKYYNTYLGKGTVKQYIKNYRRWVG